VNEHLTDVRLAAHRRPRRGLWALVALVLVAGFAVTSVGEAGAAVPAGFTDTVVFGGLVNPTVIQFAPDGRIFVAQKDGRIFVYHNLGGAPTLFADLRPQVHDFWDRGLLGMALPPGFPTTDSHVYVLYTYDAPIGGSPPTWGDGCPTPPGATSDGCLVSARLSRLTASGDVMTGTEQVLINDWCQQFPSHSIGTVLFGNDGALYAAGGDGASFNAVDYGQFGNTYAADDANPCGDPPGAVGSPLSPPGAEGGALRSQSVRRTDGPATLDGTIIRVDPATGQGLATNPFASSGDANKRRVIAYGMRNPFRFTTRPGTDQLWVGDVGWGTWEEIDRIANTRDTVAENFGWPCYEGSKTGSSPQPSYQSVHVAQCDSLTAAAVTAPVFAYDHSTAVVSGDGCPTSGGSSISGMAFYTGTSYPAPYRDGLFFADHSRNCIWVMRADSNGNPDPTLVQAFEAGAGHPVDLKAGPNGDIFYADLEGGSIHRITYQSANQAPTARIMAQPTTGSAPLTVQFDGSGSTDPEGGTLAYAWDLDGDGAYDDGTASMVSWTYTIAGTYTAGLRVTDSQGASGTASVTITVGNTPPVPVITNPPSTFRWKVGDTIPYQGSATDAQDGSIPPSGLTWDLIIHHCDTPSDCHTHTIQTFTADQPIEMSAPDHAYPSYLELRLTATDSGGLTASTSVRLDPLTVNLTFKTNPGGLRLTILSNQQALTVPFTRTFIVNSAVFVDAPASEVFHSSTYNFVSWSDGGARLHTITAPAVATTYTATYRKR
jgi:glucose/arabinose dehydrogenase/PKD repeat protein